VLLLVAGASCGGEPPPPPFDLDAGLREELGIHPDIPIHRITIGGRGSRDRVVPLRTEARPGDVLHILSADRRIQTFRFLPEGAPEGAMGFLERTGQVGSPPLSEVGNAWIVSLEGAPEGGYPFLVEGHGDPVQGVVDVRRRRSPRRPRVRTPRVSRRGHRTGVGAEPCRGQMGYPVVGRGGGIGRIGPSERRSTGWLNPFSLHG